MILACDVGGTKTDIALFRGAGHSLQLQRRETYASRDHGSLVEIVAQFMGPSPDPLLAAAFGVPGPVADGRAKTTNLPWTIEGDRLAKALGLEKVALLNDLEAQAWYLQHLAPSDHSDLQTGVSDTGNMSIIAAGTGLGCASLLRGDGPVRVLGSEGGHADFAPFDDTSDEFVRYLRQRFGHVSVERVVSGPGIYRAYQFLRDRQSSATTDGLAKELEVGDPVVAIARAAIEGRSALAEDAVLLFLAAYGAETGNWALRTLSTGGIYLGGGVARKLLVGPPGTPDVWRKRAAQAFLTPLRAKGQLSPLLGAMPVRAIVSDLAALKGSACYALRGVAHP